MTDQNKPVPGEGVVLGEGLYWMAEKLAWGYDSTAPDPTEALRLFRQSGALGFSDAFIRVGQFFERGKGVQADPKAAIGNYRNAIRAGNMFGYAFLALLLFRTEHLLEAEESWNRFAAALRNNPGSSSPTASIGEILHDFISIQIRRGFEPSHRDLLVNRRLEIVGHHQQMLEHSSEKQLRQMAAISRWVFENLGPWPP